MAVVAEVAGVEEGVGGRQWAGGDGVEEGAAVAGQREETAALDGEKLRVRWSPRSFPTSVRTCHREE